MRTETEARDKIAVLLCGYIRVDPRIHGVFGGGVKTNQRINGEIIQEAERLADGITPKLISYLKG